MYSKVSSTDIQHFKSIVGDDYVFLNDEISDLHHKKSVIIIVGGKSEETL